MTYGSLELGLDDSRTRVLCLSIIERAVEDAQGKNMLCENKEELEETRKDAVKWLTRDSIDLRYICHLAQLPWERVVERGKEIVNELQRQRRLGQGVKRGAVCYGTDTVCSGTMAGTE